MGILSKKKNDFKRIKPMEEVQEEGDVPVYEEPEQEEKPKERIIIVKELPVKEIRTTKAKDGTILHLMTVEEALTELIN